MLPMQVLLSLQSFPLATEQCTRGMALLAACGVSAVFLDWGELFPWDVDSSPESAVLLHEQEVAAIAESARCAGVEIVSGFPLFAEETVLLGARGAKHLRNPGQLKLEPGAPGVMKRVTDLMDGLLSLLPETHRIFVENALDLSEPDGRAVWEAFVHQSSVREVEILQLGSGGEPLCNTPLHHIDGETALPVSEVGDGESIFVFDPGSKAVGIDAIVDRICERAGKKEVECKGAGVVREGREALLLELDLAWVALRSSWGWAAALVGERDSGDRAVVSLEHALGELDGHLAGIREMIAGSALKNVRAAWVKLFINRNVAPLEEAGALLRARLRQAGVRRCE